MKTPLPHPHTRTHARTHAHTLLLLCPLFVFKCRKQPENFFLPYTCYEGVNPCRRGHIRLREFSD